MVVYYKCMDIFTVLLTFEVVDNQLKMKFTQYCDANMLLVAHDPDSCLIFLIWSSLKKV